MRVLRHDRSGGQSAAVHSGVRVARGGIICTLDGDGQNPPEELVITSYSIHYTKLYDAEGRGRVDGGLIVGPASMQQECNINSENIIKTMEARGLLIRGS